MTSKRHSALVALLAITLVTSSSGQTVFADPCGMVPPPLQIASSRAIERIGVQKTYVAFDKGIETMVLRPGFQGKVEEFGMLIPFPTPPSIRKVDDNIFAHLSAAIDPPEVIARVQRNRPRRSRGMRPTSKSARSAPAPADMESNLAFDEVRVVRQEAVGMYEVAVLAAGGSKALQTWMNDNGFRYPDGMDDVVADYVKSKWFFVAIKTNVGQKAGVNPRPGMRQAVSKRPTGSTFNGFVQAMGFRFRTKELVVPMRLSVFNAEGNSRNIVYALTDDPSKITGIPEGFVKRQVSGRRLHQNVTNPLPLRVIGGTKKDLNASQIANLPSLRDPTRHNGLARELFAADMLAIRKGRLVNKLEEKEKALLNLGEAFGMRGRVIDDLNRAELKKQRDKLGKQALSSLRKMTLTVIDGAFDRKVLAKQNLKFQKYRMAKAQNSPQNYDAVRQGPGFNQGGTIYRWELAYRDDGAIAPGMATAGLGGGDGSPLWPIAGFLLIGGALFITRKRLQGVAIAALLIVGTQGVADAQHAQIAVGSSNSLITAARNSSDPIKQGNAILELSKKGTSEADVALADIASNSKYSALVRSWAAAGQIQMASTMTKLRGLEGLTRSFPATRRTWTKSMAVIARQGGPDELFMLVASVPEMRTELQGELAALPAKTLLNAMLTSSNQQVRQQSASFLGAKGKGVSQLVVNALRFNNAAKKTPWNGGAHYLPTARWITNSATAVANHLLRWMLWAEKKNDQATMRVAANNLRSTVIASAAGYSLGTNSAAFYTTEYWLGLWTKSFGAKAAERVMRDVK
jgi:hypothetical protein